MPKAARHSDEIGHSPTMSWLMKGLMIGAAIAVAGVLIAGTGGLAAVAIVGGVAAGGAGIGEMMSTMSFAPKEVVGVITAACVNVFTNALPAVRAHLDFGTCSKHPSPPALVATGSAKVFINGYPAGRVDDKTICSAVITSGSDNVFIGGGTAQTDPISPENLVPGWVHGALLVVGLASAAVLAGPLIAVAGLVGGVAGGMGGGILGGMAFGEGSDGQKWSALAGSVFGGLLGAKGATSAWNYAKAPPPTALKPPVPVKPVDPPGPHMVLGSKEAAAAARSYNQAKNTTGELVIGRLDDTAAGSELGMTRLNEPDWTINVNDAWIQGGIDAGKPFYLGSNISPNNLRSGNPTYPFTVFFRELKQLRDAGYYRQGNMMLPPRGK